MIYINNILLSNLTYKVKPLQSKLHNCDGIWRCCNCLKENNYSVQLRLAIHHHSHTLYSVQLRILGLIEAVRIHKDYRGKGIGSDVFKWAIEQAKAKNCYMVQLTSNKQRSNAIRFYKKLGFEPTHEGFKLVLS